MRENPAPHGTGRTPRDNQFFFGDPLAAEVAPEVFQGLSPRLTEIENPSTGMGELAGRALRNGVPLLMTGSLAVGVGVSASIPVATPSPDTSPGETKVHRAKSSIADLVAQVMSPATHRVVSSVAPDLPATYRVKAGDTVTSVAEKFAIPTPLLLGLNGLSWNSILHEGQVLSLTGAPGKQRGMAPQQHGSDYLVQPGDTLSTISARLGVSVTSLAEANSLSVYDLPPVGHRLTVPREERANPGGFASTPTATVVLATFDDVDLDAPADQTDQATQSSPEATENAVSADPLALAVAEAPELRGVKKEQPRQAPVPIEKPAEANQRDESDDDEENREEESSSVGKPVSGAITPLNDTRRKNAQVIVDVGRDLGVSDYGIVIALATAMQESSLRNIDWGDRDSVGLFQQRPSSGWGSPEQLLDPGYAARAFYGGAGNPNPGRIRGLLDYSGWQSQSLTVAAQRVQRSAHPDAYAKWEASAWAWLDELG